MSNLTFTTRIKKEQTESKAGRRREKRNIENRKSVKLKIGSLKTSTTLTNL